ncbi:MAG TPA: patatin-like phospholipase family protein [Thermoanaerobaculia bacterium]
MTTRALRASDFQSVAFRATGGKIKAIFWHLGVAAALEDRGFKFTTGFGPRPEPGPGQISTIVGSSAGSIFALLIAGGYDIPSIINSFIDRESPLPPIDHATIFRRRGAALRGYFRRVRNVVALRASAGLFPGSGVGRGDEQIDQEIHADFTMSARKFLRNFRLSDLLVLRSRYVLTGMEEWFRKLLGDHDAFEDLRTNLFILASDLDQPKTVVFSRETREAGWYRYASGVKPSRAAIASMAIPSVFNPITIEMKGRKHYFIDGDVYNPTEPMIEADHGCDLAIFSAFEAPYRFHPAIGSVHHLGLPFEVSQAIALTIYNRFIQSRNTARAKFAGFMAARDALAPHVDEETLERESRRIAAALEMSIDMKIVHLYPHKNPLLFFESPYDLSPRATVKMIVEASLQASELLDHAGFTAATSK